MSENFKNSLVLHGSKSEVATLQKLIDLLGSVPTGKALLHQVKEMYRQPPMQVEFNPLLSRFGKFKNGLNKVELLPFGEEAQKKFSTEENYDQYLVSVLGHELEHAVTSPIYIRMIQNASSLQESMIALLLSEAVAFKTGFQLENELNGQVQVLSTEKKNDHLRQALMGHGWAEDYVKEHGNFCEQAVEGLKKETPLEMPMTERQIIVAMQKGRYPMPSNPSAEAFNEGILSFLNIIGSDLSVQDVRAIHVSQKAATNLGAEQIQHLIQNRNPQH